MVPNNNALTSGLDQHELSHTDEPTSDWNLYIPCGYNYVESELKRITPPEQVANPQIQNIADPDIFPLNPEYC
jgi:hypothetical protein